MAHAQGRQARQQHHRQQATEPGPPGPGRPPQPAHDQGRAKDDQHIGDAVVLLLVHRPDLGDLLDAQAEHQDDDQQRPADEEKALALVVGLVAGGGGRSRPAVFESPGHAPDETQDDGHGGDERQNCARLKIVQRPVHQRPRDDPHGPEGDLDQRTGCRWVRLVEGEDDPGLAEVVAQLVDDQRQPCQDKDAGAGEPLQTQEAAPLPGRTASQGQGE